MSSTFPVDASRRDAGLSAIDCAFVLVVVSDLATRREVAAACHAAGVASLAVARIADVEHWPVGQMVIVDSTHLSPLWRTFGAKEVILVAHSAREGAAALRNGATGWLLTPTPVASVRTLLTRAEAVSGLAT